MEKNEILLLDSDVNTTEFSFVSNLSSLQILTSHSLDESSKTKDFSTDVSEFIQTLSPHSSSPEFQRNVTPNGSQRLASGEPRLCTFLQTLSSHSSSPEFQRNVTPNGSTFLQTSTPHKSSHPGSNVLQIVPETSSQNNEIKTKIKTKKIKHIVVSGGGITGFTAYGILRESEKSGFWNINDIQTFYGTSVGGLILLMLSLKFDWDTLDDYIIKRPWQNVFNLNMYSVINSIQTMGLFNIKTIESFCQPLFKAKDIKMDISMKEIFDITGIEIHLFATEFNETKLVDISYKTHPDWKVIESVYSSCCLPIMFKPYTKGDKLYYDGGVFSNYPLSHCCNNIDLNRQRFEMGNTEEVSLQTISSHSSTPEFNTPLQGSDFLQNVGDIRSSDDSNMILETSSNVSHNDESIILENNYDEIFGIKTNAKQNANYEVNENSSLFDYMALLIKKLICKLSLNDVVPIKNEIKIESNIISIYDDIYLALSDMENRIELINTGVKLWESFKNDNVNLAN